MMLRLIFSTSRKQYCCLLSQKQTFLTNAYSCSDVWKTRLSSTLLNKVNLEDFYGVIDHNFVSKGTISAIDVDVFANSIKDATYLDELRDLIHKLRLTADTGNTLESTHYATIRNYIDYGNIQDLINILKDPLNYGIFLDEFNANILLDKLLTRNDFEQAALVAAQIMLQEDFTNNITCSLCQYACYKHILGFVPQVLPEPPAAKKVEEIKVRIKFLRNPYFDDHFDISDTLKLSGKTLVWISERHENNLNENLTILGWLFYQKYDKLLAHCEKCGLKANMKIYNEVLELINRESNREKIDEESVNVLQKCLSSLSNLVKADQAIEEALKDAIENAINKQQNIDTTQQQKLFKSWEEIREMRLTEQTKRLDRAKRIQVMEEKQKELEKTEQRLWFFENEQQVDLEIESKEELHKDNTGKKSSIQISDDDYIPPEILPKRK